ncbi:Metallo-dependent phosphatase-like protein [Coniochaeta sp. 2T2.1]|nr:Metallo-dependent phosphatase-like protein [Coniochaeta sp. 2T2.1]
MVSSSTDTGSSPQPVVTFSSGRTGKSAPDLRILHYNDVYHLDPSSAEPVGGIGRFITVCREYKESEKYKGQPDLVTLFSGDVFSPSLESSITKGSHMVPILHKIGTDCACVGNHELDFGVKQFRHLASKCNFPWLLANVLDPALGENVPLGNAKRTHMITASNGVKIGLIGLGEREWLAVINSLPPNLIYRSASETARELIPQLRSQGADIIIALTHMREPNDHKLASQLGGEIDVILGGHDHFYAHSLIKGTHVLRSGSDFKQLSYLELRRSSERPGKWDVDIWRRDMVSAVKQDEETLVLVDKLTSKLKKSLSKPVGWTAAPLDARFTTVRREESNLGNFVCDIMRCHYEGDCAIMASGTIRGDQIYAPGPITLKDITDCFPFEDPIVVVSASGKNVRAALENSVSMYPALEGRFPQVSNIKFSFDPSHPAGARVVEAEIGGKPIDPEKQYTVVTRGYMARGKDGYSSLLVKPEGGECEEVVSEENGIIMSLLLRQYFMSLRVLGQWANWGPSMDRHWGKVAAEVATCCRVITPGPTASSCTTTEDGSERSSKRKRGWADFTPTKLRSRRSSMVPVVEDSSSDEDGDGVEAVEVDDRELSIMRRVFRKWCRLAGVRGQACDCLKDEEIDEVWTKAVAPKVEGRITIVKGKGA